MKVWIMSFDDATECILPVTIQGVYSTEEKAREEFEKCLRKNYEDWLDEDETIDLEKCIEKMICDTNHYALFVEVHEMDTEWGLSKRKWAYNFE